jgi:hypothetical protein
MRRYSLVKKLGSNCDFGDGNPQTESSYFEIWQKYLRNFLIQRRAR